MDEHVVLVNENDRVCGSMDKLKAHEQGKLHRAFSIFIINRNGQLLLQQRAMTKYHSGGLWSNTCCSHPRPGEKTESAARRRLFEEMGFHCILSEQFSFIYKAKLNNHLNEHEFDHVFFGQYTHDPVPDSDEVAQYQWMDLDQVSLDVKENPQRYTYWFALIWEKTCQKLERYIASKQSSLS